MTDERSEFLDKIRQQFDSLPYLNYSIDSTPKDDPSFLFIHNLVNPYYLRHQKIIDARDKAILDVGCGSGYKTLALALANPGARIIGIDLSSKSVEVAKQRLQHHGFGESVEFRVLALEDLPSLELTFDYVNCDDILYLLPDPLTALQTIKSVLKPEGIIRANLHSSRQRFAYYRAQELFRYMGLMEDNPGDAETQAIADFFGALHDNVDLKSRTWRPSYRENKESVLVNYLLQGDKGYTVPELFSMLAEADLEFINMVNWVRWEPIELFKDPDNLPEIMAFSLPMLSLEERLHLFELVHPIHRLLDFWCGHPIDVEPPVPLEDWQQEDWQQARVYLHPQLQTDTFREKLLEHVERQLPMNLVAYLNNVSTNNEPVWADSSVLASCLLPLLDGPRSVTELVERRYKVSPVDPVTLEPVSSEAVAQTLQAKLTALGTFMYVLLER